LKTTKTTIGYNEAHKLYNGMVMFYQHQAMNGGSSETIAINISLKYQALNGKKFVIAVGVLNNN